MTHEGERPKVGPPLKCQPTDTRASLVLLKGRMILVSGAEDVGHKIENLLLGEHHEQVGWHHGYLARFNALHRLTVNIHPLVGIAEIGIDRHVVSAEIDDHSAESFAIFSSDDDGRELLIDLLAWVDDLIE